MNGLAGQIWMDEKLYMNEFVRYGWIGWVDMDRHIGRQIWMNEKLYLNEFFQIWMNRLGRYGRTHRLVDMDEQVGTQTNWVDMDRPTDKLGRYEKDIYIQMDTQVEMIRLVGIIYIYSLVDIDGHICRCGWMSRFI